MSGRPPLLSIDPDRVVQRIRTQLLAQAPSPVYIRPVGAGSSLYGVLIKVEGVGIVGQYLSHSEFTTAGPDGRLERYWEIIYGVTEVFARVEGDDGCWALIPVAVFGMLTPDGRTLLERGQVQLVEHKRVKGSLIVPVSALVNLDDVMSGRDVVLRVDPYGVLQPGDLREKLANVSRQLATLKTAYSVLLGEYEKERSAREVAENQLLALRSQLEELKFRLSTTTTTLSEAESALLDMWARIRSLSTRVATERGLREKLESLLEDVGDTIETARNALRAARALIGEMVAVEREEEKPEEERREEKPAEAAPKPEGERREEEAAAEEGEAGG